MSEISNKLLSQFGLPPLKVVHCVMENVSCSTSVSVKLVKAVRFPVSPDLISIIQLSRLGDEVDVFFKGEREKHNVLMLRRYPVPPPPPLGG